MITENSTSERSQDYEKYRKKFSFLVICKDCTRSFDSNKKEGEETHCKFCASENIIVKGRNIFRYYCPACEKSYLSEEERDVCVKCGVHYLHMMRISDMSKSDRLEIQKAKIRKAFEFTKKPKNSARLSMAERIRNFAEQRKNIKTAKNVMKVKKPSRWQFTLRQNKEEMPTY
ncbi:MAG TPA: hypothetical protein VI968_03600 [archaeon]|nr:hypothetical protein [archaeon]